MLFGTELCNGGVKLSGVSSIQALLTRAPIRISYHMITVNSFDVIGAYPN